jgi:hypothetical protein
MTGPFSKPILVPNTGKEIVLDRVPLTGADSHGEYTESWLQDLLYRFPQTMPIAEIDDSFAGIVPVCKEMNTPVGPVDVVYITPTGRPVVVEVKLWRNPEARRKVVGQILDYAKELSQWNYERFDAAVRSARRVEWGGANPTGLFEVARQAIPSLDEPRFIDSVTQSLQRGDFLLMVVGDGIREGVGAIAQFIEGHGTMHFTFGLVEMAIHRMPDGAHLVQPRILAQSTIIRRTVIQLVGSGMIAKEQTTMDSDSEGPDNQDIIRTREKFREFWTELLEKLVLDDKSQPVSKPAQSTNQNFPMPGSAWVGAYLAQSESLIGVYLTFPKGAVGDRLYEGLQNDKEAVDKALGVPVSWESDGQKHWIISNEHFTGVFDKHRQQVHSWLADRVNRYVDVFRPRLERLTREGERRQGP